MHIIIEALFYILIDEIKYQETDLSGYLRYEINSLIIYAKVNEHFDINSKIKTVEDRCTSINKKIAKLDKIITSDKTGAKKKLKAEREKAHCEDKQNIINKEIEYYKAFVNIV